MSLKATILACLVISIIAAIAAISGVHTLPAGGGWYLYAFIDIFAGLASLLLLVFIVRLERQQDRFYEELRRFDETMNKAIEKLG